MDRKLIFGLSFAFVAVVAMVYALTLVSETPVNTCLDSDGGINLLVAGFVNGTNFGGNGTYSLNDYCINNNTIAEYSCDLGQDPAVRQLWNAKCSEVNKTMCVSGRCI